MAEHTPGPWRLRHRRDGLVNIYAGDIYDVALCVRPKDAALIVAAPDLLAWIESVATDAQLDAPVPALDGRTGRQIIVAAHRAWAVAEGRG